MPRHIWQFDAQEETVVPIPRKASSPEVLEILKKHYHLNKTKVSTFRIYTEIIIPTKRLNSVINAFRSGGWCVELRYNDAASGMLPTEIHMKLHTSQGSPQYTIWMSKIKKGKFYYTLPVFRGF